MRHCHYGQRWRGRAGEAKRWTMKVRDEMTKIEERKEIPQGIASLRTASIYRALAGAESPFVMILNAQNSEREMQKVAL